MGFNLITGYDDIFKLSIKCIFLPPPIAYLEMNSFGNKTAADAILNFEMY